MPTFTRHNIIMEQRITTKVETHQTDFKNKIRAWLEEKEPDMIDKSGFLKYVYDHEKLTLTKDDFQKRKRVKNQVPQYERCTSFRANGEQCTRRRKDKECFCGTHVKGTPHGVLAKTGLEQPPNNKVEVRVHDIQGILYYIDMAGNVYKPDDILANIVNPRKIGKWEKDAAGVYHIPCLNL